MIYNNVGKKHDLARFNNFHLLQKYFYLLILISFDLVGELEREL